MTFVLCYGAGTIGAAEIPADTSAPRLPAIPLPASASSRDSARLYRSKGQVVVTGTRNEVLQKDSPVRVEVVNKEQMRTSAMVNLGDILREQTGMNLTTNVRTGVQMMGLGADYTQILIDGQPMIGRVAGVLDLSRISVGNIERVEIVKGPMSSLYGSEALAGVINIITRRPADGWSGKLYGQYLQKGPAEMQAEIGHGSADLDVNGFISIKNAKPFTLQQDSISVPYQGFRDFTSQARLRWFALPNLKTGADIRYFNSASRGKFIESFFGQVASNEGSVDQHDISATLSAEWTHGKARLTAQLHGSAYSERYNFDSVQGSGSSVDDLSRRLLRSYLQYDVFWSLKNRFTFGIEHNLDDIGGTRYPDKPYFGTTSIFAQWEGNPASWISYALSARYVKNTAYDNPVFNPVEQSFDSSLLHLFWLSNPKLAVNIKLNDNLRLHTSVGTGFKVPDFRQLYVQFSNRLGGAGYDLIGARRLGLDLQPERSTSVDLGLIWDGWDFSISENLYPVQGWMELRTFRNALTNLIEFYFVGSDPSTSQAIYSYRNISRALTQGLEYNIRLAMPLDEAHVLGFSAGYQYLDARDVEIDEAISRGVAGTVDPATGAFRKLTSANYQGLWFRSRHSGTMRLQYDDKEQGISCNLRIIYTGTFGDEALDKNGAVYLNRRVADLPQEMVPGYALINIAFAKTWKTDVPTGFTPTEYQITAGINNAANTMNLRSVPNLAGRQFFMNATLRW